MHAMFMKEWIFEELIDTVGENLGLDKKTIEKIKFSKHTSNTISAVTGITDPLKPPTFFLFLFQATHMAEMASLSGVSISLIKGRMESWTCSLPFISHLGHLRKMTSRRR